MGLRDVIAGWLRHGGKGSEDLAKAEATAIENAYAEQGAEANLEQNLGRVPGEFERDQEAPRS